MSSNEEGEQDIGTVVIRDKEEVFRNFQHQKGKNKVKNIVVSIDKLKSPDSSPNETKRKDTGSRVPKGPPCNKYKPQRWRQEICADCWHTKLDHAESLLEEQLIKEDPTEVFQLVRIVGLGSFASVYMCREKKSDKIKAIKFLKLQSKGNEIRNLVNEINILKESLECPFVVDYFGCYMKDDVLMMVMEYCYCSLADILKFCPEVPLKEIQIAAVCAAVVKGLAYMHSNGISHRDIKPGNILLTEEGEIKIADFGISVKLRHDRDRMKTFAGSPYWCAPEVITNDSYDKKVDVWSLGIVAIEMAETKPPHWKMDPYQVIFHVPKQPSPKLQDPKKWSNEFNDFIEKCVKKDPKDRLNSKDFLQHPFILQGSSSQILPPLIKECKPFLLTRKMESLKGDGKEIDFLEKGTLVTLDMKTQQADILRKQSIQKAETKDSPTKAINKRINRASLLIQRIRRVTLVTTDPVVTEPTELPNFTKDCRFFGAPLDNNVSSPNHVINLLIDRIVKTAIDRESILSVPGDSNKIRELKQLLEKGETDFSMFNPNDVSGTLMLYLYELPEPVLTRSAYPKFLDAQQLTDIPSRIDTIKRIFTELPEPNR